MDPDTFDEPKIPVDIPKEIPAEIQEKFKKLKLKLENFKKAAVKEYKKEIVGIALLPPKEKEKEKINVLVLIDDGKSEVIPDYRLKDKIAKDVIKMANSIDKKIFLEIMLLSELKESFFDGKYEILQIIAMSATLYDPVDILAALRIAEVHKTMSIKKFEHYIVSYAAAGSMFRGEKSNDIDVYVIVDDTDVKKMTRAELKDKLRAIIIKMGFDAQAITGIKKSFHIQVYILTDFWESLKEAHPVIFTLLRDSVPLYDRGVFNAWRLLLKMGRVRPSPEAIDMHMSIGDELIKRAKRKLLGIAAEDLYYAALNPSQAALMLYGVSPPTHKETILLLDEIFVKKEKMLEGKYVKVLERAVKTFKDVEHGKLTEISGKEIDDLIKDVEEYLKRINKLFNQIEKKKEKEAFLEMYETSINVTKDILETSDIKGSLESAFKKYCQQNNLSQKLPQTLSALMKAKRDFQNKKLLKAEIDKIRREASTYIRLLVEHLQRKKRFELERATMRFKYGDKIGEAILLEKNAFIVVDIDAKDKEVQKARIEKGRLIGIEKSSIKELEEAIQKPVISKTFIKKHIFEDLKNLFGQDVEIMLNY